MGDRAPLRYAFDGKNLLAQEHAASFAAQRVTQVAEGTKEAIRALVRRAIRSGFPPRELARDIRALIGLTERQMNAALNFRQALIDEGLPDGVVEDRYRKFIQKKIRQRALLIARHETIAALDEGIRMGWEQAQEKGFLRGNEGRKWFTNPDPSHPLRPCPVCAPMDGQIRGLDEPFTTGDGNEVMGPPAHAACFPGDVLVRPIGAASAVTRRWFDGNLLVIHTAGGNRVPVTPNHPILTDRGWLPAHALDVGSQVVRSPASDRVSLGRGLDDVEMPASFHDVAEAARHSRKMVASPVPLTAEDFHGDGGGSEVAVVWSNRKLRRGLNAAIQEHPLESSFFGADEDGMHPSLPGAGAFAERLKRWLCPARRLVRRLDLAGSLLVGHLCPFHAFGLALAAPWHAGFPEPPLDDLPINAMPFSKRVFRFAGNVSRNDVIDRNLNSALLRNPDHSFSALLDLRWRHLALAQPQRLEAAANSQAPLDKDSPNRLGRDAELAADLRNGLAGLVQLDRVIRVELMGFSGHVFNLQTETGAYAANAIIVHNCRCGERLLPASDLARAREERTRAAIRAAPIRNG